MNADRRLRLAILYPGDRTARDRSDPAASRFAALFDAFDAAGVSAEPAIYHDDFANEVRDQLLKLDGVLVWHNPIEGGRDRRKLDALLRDVADGGVFVSTHPDTVLRLGTKEVLLSVRELPFGSDVQRIDSLARLRTELPERLQSGARVLKQRRGHSGIGVWRVEKHGPDRYALRHAQRGAIEEIVDNETLLRRLAPYFEDGACMIDQDWQPRLVEGITRAYLVRGRVMGFGHQAINALYPAAEDGAASLPGPRLYSDADDPRFQDLRQRLESRWVDMLCEATGVRRDGLPLLWDADFMLGQHGAETAEERYVLCEINVSSVAPYPPSVVVPLVTATCEAVDSTRALRQGRLDAFATPD